jgi:DNA-binding transcriptional regulator/RsmH inhibitor MraZ
VHGGEHPVATFTLLLDSARRVSAIGVFRSALDPDGLKGHFCYPAPNFLTIDAVGKVLMQKMEVLIGRPASADRKRWTMALYGTAEKAKVDGKSRVVLSEYHKTSGGRK